MDEYHAGSIFNTLHSIAIYEQVGNTKIKGRGSAIADKLFHCGQLIIPEPSYHPDLASHHCRGAACEVI